MRAIIGHPSGLWDVGEWSICSNTCIIMFTEVSGLETGIYVLYNKTILVEVNEPVIGKASFNGHTHF